MTAASKRVTQYFSVMSGMKTNLQVATTHKPGPTDKVLTREKDIHAALDLAMTTPVSKFPLHMKHLYGTYNVSTKMRAQPP